LFKLTFKLTRVMNASSLLF